MDVSRVEINAVIKTIKARTHIIRACSLADLHDRTRVILCNLLAPGVGIYSFTVNDRSVFFFVEIRVPNRCELHGARQGRRSYRIYYYRASGLGSVADLAT